MAPHVAAGLVALVAGAVALAARKGGSWHARAGTAFVVAMLVLGVSASILDTQKTPPASPLGGLFVCYFIATSWAAARRRDGTSGGFEKAACAVGLALGVLMIWGAYTGTAAPTPVGNGPIFIMGAVCLLGGLLDLSVILRGRLDPVQRKARHLWRMLFAFFIATGSFFLGQQDVLPKAVQGSPVLFVLAFAPFAVMAFWLIRLQLGKRRRPPAPAAASA